MKKGTTISNILAISTGFLVLFVIFKWEWSLITSLVISLIGLFSEKLSKIIDLIWGKLAHLLGLIMPSILLSIIFFFFLFPISLISKLFTKDPLMLSRKYDSYFVDVDKKFEKQSLEKIW